MGALNSCPNFHAIDFKSWQYITVSILTLNISAFIRNKDMLQERKSKNVTELYSSEGQSSTWNLSYLETRRYSEQPKVSLQKERSWEREERRKAGEGRMGAGKKGGRKDKMK